MESWLELVHVGNGRVSFEHHYVFPATGDVVVTRSEIRFRSLGELTHSLVEAGFTVEQVYGDWKRGALTTTSRVIVFVAHRT